MAEQEVEVFLAGRTPQRLGYGEAPYGEEDYGKDVSAFRASVWDGSSEKAVTTAKES